MVLIRLGICSDLILSLICSVVVFAVEAFIISISTVPVALVKRAQHWSCSLSQD